MKWNEKDGKQTLFTHPLPRGWLLPYLMDLSKMFNSRWSYWIRTIENGRPLDAPIPRIDFDSQPNPEAAKNIRDCIMFMQGRGHSNAWMSFVEWLLWGFGANVQEEFPARVSEEISWHWYQHFNMGLMLKYPCDYMAWGSCHVQDMTRSHKGNGYFPTPGHVVQMMAEMQMTDADKCSKVCDPCMGTGIMLLYASNYSLRLYGQDIALDMVKMATVNAFLYVPWLACPGDGLIDWTTDKDRTDVLKAIDTWRESTSVQLPMLMHRPRTNTLGDWI